MSKISISTLRDEGALHSPQAQICGLNVLEMLEQWNVHSAYNFTSGNPFRSANCGASSNSLVKLGRSDVRFPRIKHVMARNTLRCRMAASATAMFNRLPVPSQSESQIDRQG